MRNALRAALFLLPVMFLIPHAGEFPFARGGAFSDLLISHYPNALYLQRSILESRTIPLWSPLILSGYPFSSNPLSDLFYLPGWLALLFPLPHGLNITIMLHLILGGVGMYLLLREEGMGEWGSLFGALVFESMPKLFAHLGAGHQTLIYAVAWSPWLLFFERRYAGSRNVFRFASGVVLGTIALADIRWAAYSGLFWLAFSLVNYARSRPVASYGRYGVLTWMGRFAANLLISAGIAAPVLLPLLEYAGLSTRSMLTTADSLYLSLPFGNLLGLIYPAVGGSAEWVLYPGAAALGLALYALLNRDSRRRAAFWLACIPVCLLVALGSNIPLVGYLYALPGMSLLRVPPRILFLVGMCFAAAAAYGLDLLTNHQAQTGAAGRDRSLLVLFGAAVFIALLAAGGWVVLQDRSQALARIQFAWGAGFFLASAAAIFAARAKVLPRAAAAVLLLLMALVDLISLNALSLEYRSMNEVLSPSKSVVEFLARSGGEQPFRVYSPSYSVPQHAGAWYGISTADGVDPLQLMAYSQFMQQATGVTANGYSVTLPPFSSGNPKQDNRGAVSDAQLLGLLNVRFVVSEYPLEGEGLDFLQQVGSSWIYENRFDLSRAWVQAAESAAGTEIISQPSVIIHPNRFELNASGPGLLVLSEIAYPGWQAVVDGESVPVETVGGILRGINLNAGDHKVEFVYRPGMVYLGLLLALVCWALLAGMYFINRNKHA